MSEMRLLARHTGKGTTIESTTPNGQTLVFDGDGVTGPSPMEHLLAALGACALMDVHIILAKKRLAFSDLRVECVGTRPDSGDVKPFLGTKLRFLVDGDVPQKAFDDAVRLSVEKYCSVGTTLRKGTSVEYEAKVN